MVAMNNVQQLVQNLTALISGNLHTPHQQLDKQCFYSASHFLHQLHLHSFKLAIILQLETPKAIPSGNHNYVHFIS